MQKLTLLFSLLIIASFASAQNMTTQKDVTMSLGTHNAFVLDLTEIDANKAEEYWSDYFKDISKLKRNRKADEYYAEDIKIPLISSNDLDVYSKVEDLSGNSRLYVWIDNEGAFVSSTAQAKAAKNTLDFMNNFALEAEKRHVEELLSEEEKSLKGLEKDLKGLEKDKEKYEKAIEDAKVEIIKNEENIEQNIKDQESKESEISVQNTRINKVRERLANVGKKKTKI